MRSIGSSAGLPVWFDPEKYGDVEHFGLMEWAGNLVARADWWHYWEFVRQLPSPYVEIDEEKIPSLREDFRERFLLGMKNPLLPAMNHDDCGHAQRSIRKSVEELNIHHYLDMVRLRDAAAWGDGKRFREFEQALRMQEAASRHTGDSDDTDAQARGGSDSCSMDATLFRRIADGTPDGSYYRETGVVPIMVDAHAPLEVAVEEFRQLMWNIREDLGLDQLRKKFDVSDFQRWTRMRVLPYMDLSLWASLESAKVSDYLMGVTLYPDDLESANPADRVRRSIRPLVNRLLSMQHISALVAQARETGGPAPR